MTRANVLAGLAIATLVFTGCRAGASDDKAAAGHGPAPAAATGDPSATEADLGVPIYPGSTSSQADPIKKIGTTHTTTMSDRVTDDPVDKVVSFYKAKAPALAQSKLDDGVALMGTPVAGAGEIVLSVKPTGGHTEITISNTRTN